MKNKTIFSLLLLCSMFMTSCLGLSYGKVDRCEYIDSEYSSLERVGSSTVSGQCFLTQRGGGVVTGAGHTAYLFPVTNYSDYWFIAQTAGRANLKGDNLAPSEWVWTSTCNAQGNFKFKNVPNGTYYLTGTVRWVAGDRWQGGIVMTMVEVSGEDVTDVVVNEVLSASTANTYRSNTNRILANMKADPQRFEPLYSHPRMDRLLGRKQRSYYSPTKKFP